MEHLLCIWTSVRTSEGAETLWSGRQGPYRGAARASASPPPGTPLLWSWISLPEEIPLDLKYFSLVPPLLSFIPNHFSPSPPTRSRSRPPRPAVQSSVSTLPWPVHHVHQLLLSPFLQCSISKVPRDLWFLNLVDSSCRHSFHKYLLRPTVC